MNVEECYLIIRDLAAKLADAKEIIANHELDHDNTKHELHDLQCVNKDLQQRCDNLERISHNTDRNLQSALYNWTRCDPEMFTEITYLIKVYLDNVDLREYDPNTTNVIESFSEFLQFIGSVRRIVTTRMYNIAKMDCRLLYTINHVFVSVSLVCKTGIDKQYMIELFECPTLLTLCKNYACCFEILGVETMKPVKHQDIDVHCNYKAIINVHKSSDICCEIIRIVHKMTIDKRIAEKYL